MSFFLEKNKIFLLIGFLVLGFFIAQIVIAGGNDNVSGWAWSENIGWISFNNTSGGGAIDYGVDIDTSTGVFSGYAWSENIGWISFNEADLTGCPTSPCRAELNFSTNEVSGWAKALDIDSWIRLRDTDYGVWRNDLTLPNEFRDWAWSDIVIGWISFNCIDRNICGTSDYKVVVALDSIDPAVDVFNINPVSPGWVSSTVAFDISWTVSDNGGSYLSHIEVWRANDVDGSPGAWATVTDNYYAPPDSTSWSSSVPNFPSEDGVWWYGLHALDNMGNEGMESSPIKVLIDKTQPASQIQSPASNSWYSDDFSLDTLDEDLQSGLDNSECKYKIIPYEDTDGDGLADTERPSSGWLSRTCNSPPYSPVTSISVGQDDYCKYQGENVCWTYIRSRDNAGNQHSSSIENGSIKNYHVDWTDPVVGEISPLTAEQGIGQTFSASLSDPVGKISGCWFYIDGQYEKQADFSPISCKHGDNCTVSVDHTFFDLGDYRVRFSCRDAAMNVGWSPSTTTVTVSVSASNPPIIISLGNYTTHTSTPDQQCTDQSICCTEPTTQNNCNIKFNISAYDPDGNPLTYTWDFGDGGIESNEEDPSHHYYTANTFNVVVDVFDGSDHTQDNFLITVSSPTVSVGLTADPSFGSDSLLNVDLRAIMGGSMYGTINYKFDCTNDGSWELESLGQSVGDYTAVDLCNYSSSGNYTAKVFVERGGSAEDTANINVVASDCTPGQQIDCTSPQGCIHTITCQGDSTWPSCPTDECVEDDIRGCGDCGEETCLSTCQWGTCSGEGECTPGPDCPDCLCPSDTCVAQDYYDYPDLGDCDAGCFCDTGAESGDPCEPTILIDNIQCNKTPICDSLDAIPDLGIAPLSTSFTGLAHDDDGTIVQYGFIFGDGGSGTTSENNINYIYNNPGTYCAKLRVWDDEGTWTSIPGDCPDVCTKQINISANIPPVANISCDGSGCSPGAACNGSWITYNRNCQYYFLNDSTDPNSTNPPDNNNDIIKSTWSIFYESGTPWQDPYVICTDNSGTPENEGICDLLLPSLPTSQNYYVTLTVEDVKGATNSFSRNFYVRREIAADFQCSLNPEEGWQSCNGFVTSEGEVVYFKDTSVISEGATGASSWSWAFEDGDPLTSSSQNPSASFINLSASSGVVTLDIIDNVGRTDSEQYQLQITIPLPEWEEVVPW